MAPADTPLPSAWAQDYVGLPYIIGVGECGHRAALVWRQRFGIEVEARPAFGDMGLAQRHILAQLQGDDWMATRTPEEGDAVVMWKGDRLAHVGVWVAPGHVLHCTRRDGMRLSEVEALPAEGFRLYGTFRRRAAEAQARAA